MDNPVELFYTYDESEYVWIVWFPHPLGGMCILETFEDKFQARTFWQGQIDSAEFGEE